MPVNYQTPDPGIIDRPYVQQIPLDALFKNLAYKQAKYDQGYQDAKRSLASAANIAAYGQDEQVKNEMFQKLNTQLTQFNGADLGDMSVSSQLDNLISGFNSSNDITGIHSRGATLAKMEKEEDAARTKGEDYYNPGLVAARKYYASGKYNPNVRFGDEGNLAPDFAKIGENILKMPNVTYKTMKYVDGRQVTYDVVDGDKAAQEWANLANNDPKLARYMQYKFESNHPDADWKKEGVDHYMGLAKNNTDKAIEYQKLIHTESQKGNRADVKAIAAWDGESKRLRALASQYSSVATDPTLVAADFKNALFSDFKSQEATKFGLSKQLMTASKIEADPYDLEKLRAANDMAKASMEHGFREQEAIDKNTLERGYGLTKTGEDGPALQYNPLTPKKGSTRQFSPVEESHYGEVLRKAYSSGLITADYIRATPTGDDLIDFMKSNQNNTIVKEGDNWYVIDKDKGKYLITNVDRFVEQHLTKGSKLHMDQMKTDLIKRLGPGAISSTPGITGSYQDFLGNKSPFTQAPASTGPQQQQTTSKIVL